jgi:hypothetical protein
LRILLLTHSFNGLTQRIHVELAARGHEVSLNEYNFTALEGSIQTARTRDNHKLARSGPGHFIMSLTFY